MRAVPAPEWWEQVIFRLQKPNSTDQIELTRKSLVLTAADKDGGAHVDEDLTEEYEILSAEGALGGMGIGAGDRSVSKKIEDAHFPSLRQIAHELLHSPDLLSLQH